MEISERQPREIGRAYALRTLTKNIILTELKPGALLSEKDLADEMGLSRTPVREAIIELSHTNIIEVQPQRGSQVSLINTQLVEEANFARKTMEIAIAKLVCTKITQEELANMEALIKLQEFYLTNFSSKKLMELDNEFHKSLFVISNKMQCYDLIQRMSIHFDRVRHLALHTVKDLKIIQDHWGIYDAIKNRDPITVERVIEHHLSRFQVDEEKIRELYPQFFLN
jgi:DNA-binding GntR family transcriptional regulator